MGEAETGVGACEKVQGTIVESVTSRNRIANRRIGVKIMSILSIERTHVLNESDEFICLVYDGG